MNATTGRRRRVVALSWMSQGACTDRADLPWIADPEDTTGWDRLAMAAACQDCPVLTDCRRYATSEKMTAGFWAGRHRDPEATTGMSGPGWAIDALPGLDGLGGAA